MKIENLKKNLNKRVIYQDNAHGYILTAGVIRKNDTGYYYQAELTDTKHGKSVVICKLEDVRGESE